MSDQDTPEDKRAADNRTPDEADNAAPSDKSAVQAEPAQQTESTQRERPPRKRWFRTTLLVLVIVLFAVVGTSASLGWFVWQEKAKLEREVAQQAAQLRSQVEENQAALGQLRQAQQNILNNLNERESSLTKRVRANEQRVRAQQQKLQSLSTTTREDWLLAEAEYLLRLANQRVLIERSPRSADALLVEADQILKNLEDPDLFSLRQAIASDLAQLRLVEKIDQQGIYFSLKALIDEVETLELRPRREQVMAADDIATNSNTGHNKENVPPGAQAEPEAGFWKKLGSGVVETFSFVGDYIKFRDHSEPPPALLPPDAAVYLQQNMRFKLERAQLALLREEQKIYQSSLQEAITWLQQYYPRSASTEAFIQQLRDLSDKNIIQELPDITYSLELLHQYIENLHQLDGVQKPDSQGEPTANSQGEEL